MHHQNSLYSLSNMFVMEKMREKMSCAIKIACIHYQTYSSEKYEGDNVIHYYNSPYSLSSTLATKSEGFGEGKGLSYTVKLKTNG